MFKTKEHTSAPAFAIESLLLSYVIDSKEKLCVKTLDTPGDFIQSYKYDLIHVQIEGMPLELLEGGK